MLEWQAGLEKRNSSYHPESFLLLKIFLDMMPEFFFKDFNSLRGRIPLLVWQFMESQKIHEVLQDIKKKSKDIGTFQRHFREIIFMRIRKLPIASSGILRMY